jgi:hypothetical protein
MDTLATTAGAAIDPDSIVPVQKSRLNRLRTKGLDFSFTIAKCW